MMVEHSRDGARMHLAAVQHVCDLYWRRYRPQILAGTGVGLVLGL